MPDYNKINDIILSKIDLYEDISGKSTSEDKINILREINDIIQVNFDFYKKEIYITENCLKYISRKYIYSNRILSLFSDIKTILKSKKFNAQKEEIDNLRKSYKEVENLYHKLIVRVFHANNMKNFRGEYLDLKKENKELKEMIELVSKCCYED